MSAGSEDDGESGEVGSEDEGELSEAGPEDEGKVEFERGGEEPPVAELDESVAGLEGSSVSVSSVSKPSGLPAQVVSL